MRYTMNRLTRAILIVAALALAAGIGFAEDMRIGKNVNVQANGIFNHQYPVRSTVTCQITAGPNNYSTKARCDGGLSQMRGICIQPITNDVQKIDKPAGFATDASIPMATGYPIAMGTERCYEVASSEWSDGGTTLPNAALYEVYLSTANTADAGVTVALEEWK